MAETSLKHPRAGAHAYGLRGRGDEGFECVFGLKEGRHIAVGGIGVKELCLLTPRRADIAFARAHREAESKESLLTCHALRPTG